MNLQELKNDLISKVNNGNYFRHKLFNRDKQIYARRSFDDLFLYYRQKGVTEQLLLTALYESDFSALVCANLKKVIFSRIFSAEDGIWAYKKYEGKMGYIGTRETKNTKYTEKYLKKY